MRSNGQTSLLTRIVSPYGLALISYAIFLLACSFPPSIYSLCMLDEPNYMFMNVPAIGFYSLCVMAFMVGVRLVDTFFPVASFSNDRIVCTVSPVIFLLIPLGAGLVFSVLSTIFLIRSIPDLFLLLSVQGGAGIKSEILFHSALGLAGVYLIGIVWWATWRCDQLGIQGRQRRLVKITQYLATISVILAAGLKLARIELMPAIVGVAIVYLLRKSVRARTHRAFLVKFGIVFVCSVLMAFLAGSYLRGTLSLITDIFAYTIASYNRLAALLSGRLRYPYGGRGIYLFIFLGYNNMLNMVIPFREMLRWPSALDLWQSEFSAMGPAALRENAIWSGTFGYIFADIGWFTPLFVFFEGLVCGVVWRSIKLERTFGIVLYPWLAFCILFWFGMNDLFDNRIIVYIVEIIGLSIYESLFLRCEKRQIAG